MKHTHTHPMGAALLALALVAVALAGCQSPYKESSPAVEKARAIQADARELAPLVEYAEIALTNPEWDDQAKQAAAEDLRYVRLSLKAMQAVAESLESDLLGRKPKEANADDQSQSSAESHADR